VRSRLSELLYGSLYTGLYLYGRAYQWCLYLIIKREGTLIEKRTVLDLVDLKAKLPAEQKELEEVLLPVEIVVHTVVPLPPKRKRKVVTVEEIIEDNDLIEELLIDDCLQWVFNRDFIVRQPLGQSFKFQSSILRQNDYSVLWNIMDLRVPVDRLVLCEGARRMLGEPNAGGSSLMSEVLSLEFLYRVFGAKLIRTEMQIEYWPEGSKKTDYTCEMWGYKIAVSVTRAMKWKLKGPFTRADARILLGKKLACVSASSQNVLREHSWVRQILHVFAESKQVASTLIHEFHKLPLNIRVNTVMLVTYTLNGNWIYSSWPHSKT